MTISLPNMAFVGLPTGMDFAVVGLLKLSRNNAEIKPSKKGTATGTRTLHYGMPEGVFSKALVGVIEVPPRILGSFWHCV